MTSVLRLLCAVLLTAPLGAASATGLWVGTYDYPGNAQPPVSFSAAFKASGTDGGPGSAMATGTSIEVNTFGEASAPALGGTVIIRIFPDNRVEMVKTYDGAGGVDHTVWYSGTLDPATDTISGTWYIEEGWSAKFAMRRVGTR